RLATAPAGAGADASQARSAQQPVLTRSAWRLLADHGPDMPLGATLTPSEIFGATVAAQAATPASGGATTFTPVIARAAGDAPSHQVTPYRDFNATLDGVAWVASEPWAEAAQADAARNGAMGFRDVLSSSAVPRGRD